MAMVVLGMGRPRVALVVVVMVVAVCIAQMPTAIVTVGCQRGIVIRILSCHWSRDGGSVTFLN